MDSTTNNVQKNKIARSITLVKLLIFQTAGPTVVMVKPMVVMVKPIVVIAKPTVVMA